MNFKRIGAILATAAVSTVVLGACSQSSETLEGEGATSQQNAMAHFGEKLAEKEDMVLSYNATGSGAGVKKFIAKQVVFGGSDSPLKGDEISDAKDRCDGNDPWHIPLVVGAVAIAYNIDGVTDLKLTPAVIADIFSGKITKWDDAKVASLNPQAKLPKADIYPIRRSEDSGTTDNVQKFLAYNAPKEWPAGNVGKKWLGVGNGANGSAGVAAEVKKNKNTITYVEAGFAKDLSIVEIDFGKGPVKLSDETAGKALDSVVFKEPGSKDLVVDTKGLFTMKEEGAYPFLLTTYEIVCSKGYSDEDRDRLKKFLNLALSEGQEGLSEKGYVPLPEKYLETLKVTVKALS